MNYSGGWDWGSDGGWKVMDEPCTASVSGASLGSI